MVLVEAMSCGLPVVSFDCPCGPKDIVSDKIDGILVPSGNVELFSDCLTDLLRKPEEIQRMAKNAQDKSRLFSLDKLSLQWKALFDTLMG